MSETKHYKGTVKIIEKIGDETLEDVCKRICNENGIHKLPEYYDDWEETIMQDFYKKYAVFNDNVYCIVNYRIIDDYDIFDMHDNKDGTYDFDVMFYDGGMCLEEALEKAYKGIEN